MKIFIDADGCPVVDLTLEIADKYQLKAVILCDTSHEFQRKGAETVVVSKGADSVDFALVNRIQRGDIAVTQDYGLAAMCMAKGAIPISQNGMVYTDENIDALLLDVYKRQAMIFSPHQNQIDIIIKQISVKVKTKITIL